MGIIARANAVLSIMVLSLAATTEFVKIWRGVAAGKEMTYHGTRGCQQKRPLREGPRETVRRRAVRARGSEFEPRRC